MKQQIIIWVCILCCLYSGTAYAQIATYDPIYTIPQRPTRLDSVQLVTGLFINGAALEQNFEHHIAQSNVYINSCYQLGGAGVTVHFIDTLQLGMLTNTLFTVYRNADIGGGSNGCINPVANLAKDTSYIHIHSLPFIDSITVLPDSPTEYDDVSIVLHVSTSRPGKKLSLGHYLNMSSGDFYFTGCYALTDSFIADEQYSDTIHIGKLRAQDYNIHFKAYLSDDTSICGNRVDSSLMSKGFQVRSLSRIEQDNINSHFKIIPNPAQDNITLQLPDDTDASYYIINVLGQRMLIGVTHNNNPINISQLPAGIYTILFSQHNKSSAAQFIKQ